VIGPPQSRTVIVIARRAVGVTFVIAALLGFAGCGEQAVSVDPAPTTASPPGTPLRPLLALPAIGALSWRCETAGDEVRFGTRLTVSADGATLVGEVGLGGRSRAFRVDPGEEFDTGLTSSASQRWTLVYRHAPATIKVQLSVEFGLEGAARDCVISDLRLRQRTHLP
jgi:hypothetical protein